MKIKINKNLNVKSIEEFIRVMIEKEEIEDDELEFLCFEDENKYVVKVFSKKLNKMEEFGYEKLYEKIEDQELSMCKIVLLKLYKKKYSWGSLMGVRPTKVFRRLLINGCSYEESEKILKEFYLVNENKIKLMEEIIKKELELLDDSKINIYIGIPFCPSKCSYCSFASYEINGGVGRFYSDFVETLKKEIEIIAEFLEKYPKKISSIYFGGGTPSILKEKDLEEILKKINEKIEKKYLKEFTFEAGREDTLNEEKLKIMKKYGVNRLSLNPQTFNEKTLEKVNRKFNRKNFDEIFKKAKELNFIINMDLIIGLPDEKTEDILFSLGETKKYDIDNLTIHNLSFKRASKLFKESKVREEIDRKIIEKKINEIVEKKKMKPYYLYRQKNMIEWGENIGYSVEDKESIFNIEMIEENQNTIALGGGGISKIVLKGKNGIDYIKRHINPKDPALYIKELEKRCEDKKKMFEDFLNKV